MLLEEMSEYEKACTDANIPDDVYPLSEEQNKRVAELILENPVKNTVEDIHERICNPCSLYCSSYIDARETAPCWLSFEGLEVVGDRVKCKWEASV